MPVGMKTIISDRAKNKGQEINVKSYYFEKGMNDYFAENPQNEKGENDE